MSKVLLIEDDTRLAAMLGEYLGKNGIVVSHEASAAAGLSRLNVQNGYDAVLLDLMLPDGDGMEVCKQIRLKQGHSGLLPIIIITAKGEWADRVLGLELGADDYLSKPFEPRELLARLRALLRRSAVTAGATQVVNSKAIESARLPLAIGDLRIDFSARKVTVAGETRYLTARQFDVLVALAEHAGRVLSREQLIRLLPADAEDAFDRAIDVHIARIRAAIEDDPKQPQRIVTIRGSGYQLAKPSLA